MTWSLRQKAVRFYWIPSINLFSFFAHYNNVLRTGWKITTTIQHVIPDSKIYFVKIGNCVLDMYPSKINYFSLVFLVLKSNTFTVILIFCGCMLCANNGFIKFCLYWSIPKSYLVPGVWEYSASYEITRIKIFNRILIYRNILFFRNNL